MNIHSVTICLHCGKAVPLAPAYCQLCGQAFPTQLPMPIPAHKPVFRMRVKLDLGPVAVAV
jgi:hypothetical protein